METTLEERLQRIEEQLRDISKSVASIEANTTPCPEKQKANQESVQTLVQVVNSSPIGKNPMIQEMLKPLIDLAKGGSA